MLAIVMLTALSMEDASRAAAGDAREHRHRGTYLPHACEKRGQRSPQETNTRTVRQQPPASPAQRDWAGRNPSFSSHAQTRPQTVGSGRDVTPDPLPRHAHEPSVWAKTNLETNKRQHWHCSNETWSTGTTPRAMTQTSNGTTRDRQTNTNTREHGTPHKDKPPNGLTRISYIDTYSNHITNDKGLVATQSTQHGGPIHKLNPLETTKIRKLTRTTRPEATFRFIRIFPPIN